MVPHENALTYPARSSQLLRAQTLPQGDDLYQVIGSGEVLLGANMDRNSSSRIRVEPAPWFHHSRP
jgi:hypothetical protein